MQTGSDFIGFGYRKFAKKAIALANRPLKRDVGDFTACGVNLVIILFQYLSN